MADKKISALTGATTPLAGTEVLPIVQSGATVKVATNDLTVRNVRANATTGILQVTGPTAGTTRVATVPDANFTIARTDAAQSFTGDQTLSTGNVIIGTSGKGIDFSATPGTGTSELLADYEEGSWTPTLTGSSVSGSQTYNSNTYGSYTKIGQLVTLNFVVTIATKGTLAGNVRLTGIPFNLKAGANPENRYPQGSCIWSTLGELWSNVLIGSEGGTTYLQFSGSKIAGASSISMTDAAIQANTSLSGSIQYIAA